MKNVIKSIPNVKLINAEGEELLLNVNKRVLKNVDFVIIETQAFYPEIAEFLVRGNTRDKCSKCVITSKLYDENMIGVGEHEVEFPIGYYNFFEINDSDMSKNLKNYYIFARDNSNYNLDRILKLIALPKELEEKEEVINRNRDIEQLSKIIQGLYETVIKLSGVEVKE